MRVLIVDDHEMFATSLARLLRDAHDVEGTAICTSVEGVPAAVALQDPDVVLADWNLGDGDGADVIRSVKQNAAGTRGAAAPKVVVLTGETDAEVISSAVTAGCDGFVTKDRAPEQLLDALRAAHRGEVQLTPEALGQLRSRALVRSPAEAADDLGLSRREVEVVELLASAHTNAQIADALFLSTNTVRNHLSRISTKLGVSTRMEVVARAVQAGVVSMKD